MYSLAGLCGLYQSKENPRNIEEYYENSCEKRLDALRESTQVQWNVPSRGLWQTSGRKLRSQAEHRDFISHLVISLVMHQNKLFFMCGCI